MTVVTLPYPQLGFIPFNQNAITHQNYTQRLHFSSGFPRNIAVMSSNSGMVIEKENEFKPSFDEYLKVMETVKIRREKRKNVTESPSPLSKVDEETVELGDTQNAISEKKVETLGQNDVKKIWVRKKMDIQDSDINKVSSFRNSKQNDDGMKKWTRKKLDSGTKEVEMDSKGFQKIEVKNDKFYGERFRGSEMSVGTSKSYVMNKERVVNWKKLSRKSDNSDNVEIERAAFKSLEENPNVCDQPRVSRVEMEERIHRLAKW